MVENKKWSEKGLIEESDETTELCILHGESLDNKRLKVTDLLNNTTLTGTVIIPLPAYGITTDIAIPASWINRGYNYVLGSQHTAKTLVPTADPGDPKAFGNVILGTDVVRDDRADSDPDYNPFTGAANVVIGNESATAAASEEELHDYDSFLGNNARNVIIGNNAAKEIGREAPESWAEYDQQQNLVSDGNNSNVVIGDRAFRYAWSAKDSIAIGRSAGGEFGIQVKDSIYIGREAEPLNNGNGEAIDNEIVIGNGVKGHGDNTTTIGGDSLYVGKNLNVGDGIDQSFIKVDAIFPSSGSEVTVVSDLLPFGDGGYSLGSANFKWSELFASTDTINTSDARLKTEISEFTVDELNAAKELSKRIGTYKFLSAVASKGDAARLHIGLTVQEAISIMEANNLDPFKYGFICYDEWNAKYKTVIDVKGKPKVEAWEETYGDRVISHPEIPAVEEVSHQELVSEAGNSYGFRYTELLAFICRGFEERLSALENA